VRERRKPTAGYSLIIVVLPTVKMPLTISVKVVKIWNSLRMTIPKPVSKALDINEGYTLEVGLTDGSMIVKKA